MSAPACPLMECGEQEGFTSAPAPIISVPPQGFPAQPPSSPAPCASPLLLPPSLLCPKCMASRMDFPCL